MGEIRVVPGMIPELDPGFVPAALWNRSYRAVAAASGRRVAIALERSNGAVSRFDTVMGPDDPGMRETNFRYLERLVKFLLWSCGGWHVTVAGAEELVSQLQAVYSSGGERAFDAAVMGRRVYDHDFTITGCPYDEAPAARPVELRIGGHWEGCRIGFDLGGSDRKCAAVIDGKVVFSEEVPWDPYFQTDIAYHRAGILDSLKRAAAKLPRIDAIGGSAAGIYVNSCPRLVSLFRGIPEAEWPAKVHPLFDEISREFPGVPFVVLNDGEVTALAGAISLKRNAMLGVSMGTSEAVGYVTPDGVLTDYLNELAFAPIDYRIGAAPRDEWSGDVGVGAGYLSQQAVARLAAPAGFDFKPGMSFPEILKLVQQAMAAGDRRAEAIYRTVGCYLGYAVAHYAVFYELKNLLLLGRVSSGLGGEVIIETARRVLAADFPELDMEFHIPDETFKRHGQAVIAATL